MGSPLRILHVVVNMNRGGAETLIMNLYRNIDRTKVQFDFLTCKEGVFDQEIIKMGGKVYRVPYVTDVGHFGYVKALDTFFKQHTSYRVIHSHMDKMSGLVLKSAKKNHIPVRIAHSHSTQSEGRIAPRLYKWIIGKQIHSNATNLFACSRAAGSWLFGSKGRDVSVIKNGIECNKFSFSSNIRTQIRTNLKIGESTFVLGHVGRFSQPKNHLFLLNIFKEFTLSQPDSILVLAGDGPLKKVINEKVRELGLENKVMLLGVRDDIPSLLQAFDLFVFPSLYEGLPLTLIEAQGAGLPCYISDTITSEVDMGMQLIHYISIEDEKAWVQKLIHASQNQIPRVSALAALIHNGYDIQKTAASTEKSYLSLGGEVI
ncbi:glycosyltransferase family 1 protein [Bacillus spongiae]|uniref:Glycosyltransferase family 1 protein n=1 Tax=Bacillus spongiae TaxID=2683610 RepID=A0ABU8HFC1_9BACI